MPPNTCKFESFDVFATIDKSSLVGSKSLFTSKQTPLLSTIEITSQAEVDPFSASFLESQLLAEVQRRQEEQVKPTITYEAEDDYWGWCNDETTRQRKQKENEKLLKHILEEEENRIFFSAEEVEKRLVRNSKITRNDQEETKENIGDAACDEVYWVWKSDQDVHNELFSALSLENNLIFDSQKQVSSSSEHIQNSPGEKGNYWGWCNEETPQERQQKDNKKLLENLLFEEEIRKSFSVNEIEKHLFNERKLRSNEEKDTEVVQGYSPENEYWDF